ncbi:MAG: DUF721 domain-containing protein [Rickettsiaceae bacterium]|nr:DUF721 domain-containing protein [Rickettsiaceae bacterium]
MTHSKLSDSIAKFLKKVYKKNGEDFAEIAANWNKIVGSNISYLAIPAGLKYFKTASGKTACLTLLASSPSLVLELQFAETAILERVNQYFGYKAINSIKIKK